MLKRTLYFTKPCYLSTRLEQLVITPKEEGAENSASHSEPIEDLGFVVLDHPQISVSQTAFQKLSACNVAVIFCNDKHLPGAMLLPLDAHREQSERFREQIEAGEPLKKQCWKQTIEAKISNQARLFELQGLPAAPLRHWASEVLSGDSTNREALAARYYWEHLFAPVIPGFYRDRYGPFPNNLLNYGYAIIRAAVARALAGSGLLTTLGIQHHNKYNAFCLADDIMEPYRPFVDELVRHWVLDWRPSNGEALTQSQRVAFLQLLARDVRFEGFSSPMMIGMTRSAASLARCFSGESRKMVYPTF